MNASDYVKGAGIESMKEFSALSKTSTRVLNNYYNNDRQKFDVLLAGSVMLKKSKEESGKLLVTAITPHLTEK